METVEVVIRIPAKMYKNMINDVWAGSQLVADAVKNGTVLPKGHGELVEWGKVVDIVTEYVPDDEGSVGNTNLKDLLYEVENMELVIGADKEVDNGQKG